MNPIRRSVAALLRKARGPGARTLYTSLAGQGMTLISGVIAARALGPEGRGTLALLWLLPLTLVLIGGLGLPQATTFYVARERELARGVVAIAVKVTVALAVVMLALYGVGLLFLAQSAYDFSALDGILSLVLVPMFLSQNLGIATLLGCEKFTYYNLARVSPVAAYALGSAVLFLLNLATLTSILAAALAAWAVGSAITWAVIHHTLPSRRGRPDVTRKQMVGFGARGVIGSVSPVDDVRLDQFLVGLVLDARTLGLYAAAIAFCNLPRFVAMSIGAISFPRIAAARLTAAAWSMVSHYLRLGLTLVGLTVGVLVVLVPWLLPFLFGGEFRDAVGLSRLLLFGAFFLSLHRLLTELARGLGHPGYASITEGLNAAVFVVAVLVIGPTSGGNVAWAVVAGGMASSSALLALIATLRRRRSPARRSPIE